MILDNTCVSSSMTDGLYLQFSDDQATGQISEAGSYKLLKWKSNVVWDLQQTNE